MWHGFVLILSGKCGCGYRCGCRCNYEQGYKCGYWCGCALATLISSSPLYFHFLTFIHLFTITIFHYLILSSFHPFLPIFLYSLLHFSVFSILSFSSFRAYPPPPIEVFKGIIFAYAELLHSPVSKTVLSLDIVYSIVLDSVGQWFGEF